MSEPKLISPMLDDFMIGSSMCSRQGIMCCPAMPKNSDKKYIVKIISIPASQVQMDALLLTGAYQSQEQALAYFKSLADKTIEEVGVLKKLSTLEGFLPFESYQLVEKEEEPGYQLYLLGSYKPSLQQQMSKHNMTHLNAVNLGLDMCASLAVCRRAGYLYADLKPQNIFVSDDGEYRIGDLGFLPMDGLKYATLDERFHSAYTAPEMRDIFASINTTIDTYAAGMILYQVYSDGKLPTLDGNPLPPPQYADYEMAEIIMKAIDPEPEKRWADPIVMGQAIVAYMQKNGANNVPIVPFVQDTPLVSAVPSPQPEVEAPAETKPTGELDVVEDSQVSAQENAPEPADAPESNELPQPEEAGDESIAPVIEQLTLLTSEPEDSDVPMTLADLDAFLEKMESDTVWEEEPPQEPAADASIQAEVPAAVAAAAVAADEILDSPVEAEVLPAPVVEADAEPAQEVLTPEESPADAPVQEETSTDDAHAAEIDPEDPANLAFMADLVADETAPSEDFASDVGYDELSSETSDILALADELLLHETPSGVVAPEPIEVPMPEPIVLKAEEPEEAPELAAVDADFQPPPIVPSSEYYEAEEQEDDEDYDDEDDYDDLDSMGGSSRKWLIGILIAVLLAALLFGSYYFYSEYYIQKINGLEVEGNDTSVVVHIDSDIDDKLLKVVCVDNHGTKRHPESVKDGCAVFTGLNTDTPYTISVEIDGFHKLVGDTSITYNTPKTTKIYSFQAKAGTLEGQVTLSFKVEGPTPVNWRVTYSTEGEPERSQTFISDMVTISGLTIGKTYTFTLSSDEQSVYLAGENSVSYQVQPLVKAQNVQITGCSNGKLSVAWEPPADHTVESWIVTCYNNTGLRQEVTTANNSCEFAIEDATQEYHVEVKAVGMSSGITASIKANSVTIQNFVADTSNPQVIKLSWDYTDAKPEGKVIVLYSIGDSEIQQVAETNTNHVEILHAIPNTQYTFTLQLQSAVTLFENVYETKTPPAPQFEGYRITKDDLKFTMCETPAKDSWSSEDGWTHKDIKNFTNSFKVGQQGSFKVVIHVDYDKNAEDEITTMYVIRDKQGNVVSSDTSVKDWNDMWYIGMCSLDVPKLPEKAGDYTIEVYFNGRLAHQQAFVMNNP